MPVAYVDIPAGVNDGAKEKIFRQLYEEIHEAWPIPDTRVLIREWPNEAVSQEGRIEDVPMRPPTWAAGLPAGHLCQAIAAPGRALAATAGTATTASAPATAAANSRTQPLIAPMMIP